MCYGELKSCNLSFSKPSQERFGNIFSTNPKFIVHTASWSQTERPAFAVHEVGAAEGPSPEAAPSFCCA